MATTPPPALPCLFGLLAMLPVSLPAASPASPATIQLETPPMVARWEGWGTSLCWWANVFGQRDDIADLFYTLQPATIEGQTLPGLGMTIVRYNAGACGDRPSGGKNRVKSKTIRPYREMPGFWLDEHSADPASASWDWSVDANQRAALLKAKDRGVTHFELFSNSPMWWMCANQNPSGAVNPRHDNLSPSHERNFAIYLAEVARQSREVWGIPFTTVEPFNEPTSAWWDADCKQEGCHFSAESQIRLLPLLREELDRRGLQDLHIAASDENQYSESLAVWNSYPATTKVLVEQVNVHGYQYKEGPRREVGDAVRADRKRLWNSEHGDGDPTGLLMARCITLDWHELRPTAWCYWQPLDEGGWGFIQANLFNGTLGPVNPKYYIAAHYFRHLRAGMEILDTKCADAVAARDPDTGRTAVVIVNDTPEDRTYRIEPALLPSGEAQRWLTRPAGTERYATQPISRADLESFSVPAASVVTVEFTSGRL